MAKIESVLRQINRRLADVHKKFGGKSVEYMEFKSLLFTSFQAYGYGDSLEELLRKTEEGKPVQLSRSQSIVNFLEEREGLELTLRDVWDAFKSWGSVSSHMKKYEEELKNEGVKDFKVKAVDYAQKVSYMNYIGSFFDDDFYENLEDEIEAVEQGEIEDPDYIEALKDIWGYFHQSNEENPTRYEDAMRRFQEARVEHQEWIKEQVLSSDSEEHSLGGNNTYDMSKRK